MTPQPRCLLVIGHARAHGLCHHLAEVVEKTWEEHGVEYRVHDLLADGFDPCLRLGDGQPYAVPPSEEEDPLVHRYCEDVKWADRYVFVHPVYWFAPPAILKGWIDRVFVEGVAVHQPEDGPPEGLLHGKRALVVQTFGAPEVADKVVFRGLAGAFWKRAVFFPTGIKGRKRLAIYSVDSQSEAAIASRVKRLRKAAASLIE